MRGPSSGETVSPGAAGLLHPRGERRNGRRREENCMSPLRVALIGAGRRGRGAHLPVIARMTDRSELVAVGDVDPEAARVAEEYGARGYTSLRELVAEDYYRAPVERLKSAVIAAGAIGAVSRLHRIFHEGGYHGMSLLRHHAGAAPTSVLAIAHEMSVLPHTDRMERRHTREAWSLGIIDFDNGALAVMAYSNVIHARSLGRGQAAIGQIDGTAGTILEEVVYTVPPAERETGARADAHPIQRRLQEVGGKNVLE